jgi:hypothetical protein
MDTINPGLVNSVAGVSPTAGFNAVDTHFRPPDSYQWNLTLSREIMKDTVLEVSYIGNEGHHIWRRNVQWNNVPPGPARTAIATAVREGNSGLASALIIANRRIPTIGPISMSESTGNSNYHALQVWLNRRFSDRLAYQASYTWGHAISDVPLTAFTDSASDPFNFKVDKGDADLDRRHTFIGNAIYVLPSFSGMGKFANAVLGDWQLNGIFSYYSSTPVNLVSGVNTAGVDGSAVAQRPNLVEGVPIYLHTSDATQWLNPAAFALPAPGQLGSLGRGAIRGKPITTFDASLNKNFRFRERYNIQFRAEAFNLFNHPNFVGFNNNLAFTSSGVIGNTGFGTLNATQNHREIQFGLKFYF